ncbi:acyltransferase family protein [Streptomyces sp. MJP52]|uniref:acyltransferase family protein n=1 Tax=Streptomyces sp. MJP52 TaxID=2940555 RepID=UPI002475A834|nr:acyltransferase family protein [Streptomyces sp. MJP52]MDH6226967.1 fucose 4-O-acetylase-like acetyltransferase [Streptomyces sp. MJP52]
MNAPPQPHSNQHTQRSPLPPAGQRDSFFDNAKYLAIVLVAMGHVWEPLREGNRTMGVLYMVVYAFHMPAFIVISGYFSRSFAFKPHQIKRLLSGVVVPYIVFETAYSLFRRWAHEPDAPISLLDPWYLTWFLAALFVWRLTTPMWRSLRHPLAVALAIAMLATVSPKIGNDLDMQRALQFLPYFVLGLCLKPEHFKLVRTWRMRILALPVFAAALVVGWWAKGNMNTAWFYHRDAAQELGGDWWIGPLMTLGMFGCSVLLTACFFAWVPGRRLWFTALGAGTISGYLLHGFLVKGGIWFGWFDHDLARGPMGVLLCTALAVAVVTVLCSAPVRTALKPVLEPNLDRFFREDEAAARAARTAAPAEGPGTADRSRVPAGV